MGAKRKTGFVGILALLLLLALGEICWAIPGITVNVDWLPLTGNGNLAVGRGESVGYTGYVHMGSTWFHIYVDTPWGTFPEGEWASHGGEAVFFYGTFSVPADAPLGYHDISIYATNGYDSGSESHRFLIKDKGFEVHPVQTTVVAGEDLFVEAVVKGIPSDPKTVYLDAPWGTVPLTNYTATYSTSVDTFTFSQYVHVPYETLSGSYTLTFRVTVNRYSDYPSFENLDGSPGEDTFTASLPITVLKPPDVRELTATVDDTFALSGLTLGVSAQTPSSRAVVENLRVFSSWGVEALMQTSDGVYFRGQLPVLKNTKTGPMEVKVFADISQPPHYPVKHIERTLDVFVKNTGTGKQPYVPQKQGQDMELPDWWTPPWYGGF